MNQITQIVYLHMKLIASENYKLLDILISPKETHKDKQGKPYYAVPSILRVGKN